MKDIMLRDDELCIDCEINGLELALTWSDYPTYHYMFTLRTPESYGDLKRTVNEIFNSWPDSHDGWHAVNDYLQTADIEEFVEEDSYVRRDYRTEIEISEYLKEAWDKVWLMRSCCISEREPVYEASRSGMERILAAYDDIPEDGYDTWECGYWNGILGALRWVTGDEKDFLDT